MKNLLIKKLEEIDKFKELIEQIESKQTPINISGLDFVGKSHIVSAISNNSKRPICIITYNELQAKQMVKDLSFFTDKIEYLGKREIASYNYISESKDLPYSRIDVLNKIYNKEVKIVITTIEAVMQSIIPKEILYNNVLTFNVGSMFECKGVKGKKDLNRLKQLLLLLGYERNDLVENRGQFSIRGGICDIGLSEKKGIRIEFWGDEVDSIRYFSISSQRTTEMTNKITIFPAHEYILNYKFDNNDIPEYSEIASNITNKIREKYLKEVNNKTKVNDKIRENIKADIEAIENGEYISKIDKYFDEFYEKKSNFLDYISKKFIVFVNENLKINQRIENIIIENNNLLKSLTEKERFIPEAIKRISEFSKDEWNNLYKAEQVVYLDENNSNLINKFEFSYRPINFYKSETEVLISDIKKWISEKTEVIILAGNKENVKKIESLLQENNINSIGNAIEISNLSDTNITNEACPNFGQKCGNRPVPILTGGLSTGFECYDLNLVVVSMADAFDIEVKKKKSNATFKQGEKVVFADLKQGDIVVHKSHGIGQFIGVNTIRADGVTKDYIKIKYKNDDMLYVPTNNLDNVRKYIGGGDSAPKLNKLGSKEWTNTKAKVKKNLREISLFLRR